MDVGGRRVGEVQYHLNYGQRADRWIVLNISAAAHPDLVADAAALPLASGSVDVVLCSQVLEHISPDRVFLVIKEMHRVLRNQDGATGQMGELILSAPFLYRIHGAPQDYLRFTEYSLQRGLEQAGFRIVAIEKIGLFFTVLCDIVKQAIGELRPAILRWVLGMLFLPVAEVLIRLDNCPRIQRSPVLSAYTTGYLVIAKKG